MARQNKFGTFSGVFTPSILTILGVIMYLRLPFIVGQAGFIATIGIILVAHVISITTGLSVSSIATDKKVEAGGTYYIISRSLGLPIGGTLGIALFVGLSFSVSLYLIGFSESFLNYWGWNNDINSIRLTGTVILLAVTILTFISTSLAIKTQYFIMAAIFLSLLSIFFGHHENTPQHTLISNPSSTVPQMVLFGIFFPAVTGFEAGVSMSGDLKDPKKSIPQGTIMAIAVGFIVYIGLSYFLSSTVSRDLLVNDSNVLLMISWVPELVVAGIWGATLSSALGSILGAPRILQATAHDAITPRFFAKGYGLTNEPRNALLLTFLIAEAGILIGELNVIARVVSIFFITTYGFLNTSAAFESWTSADFRPEFKIPGWISALGAIACFIVMIQLDFLAMLAAILILGLLFLLLKRRELTLESGDAWSGVWASLVRNGLSRLKAGSMHNRNWRPNIIMFSGNPETRKHMVDMGKAISGKLGILSAIELVQRTDRKNIRTPSVPVLKNDTPGYFHKVVNCSDVYQGMEDVARLYGFSGVEPNTILMGWSKNKKTKENFTRTIQNFEKLEYNSLFLNYDDTRKYGNQSTIDIWWSGSGRNLTFAINLIRHITYSRLWHSAMIRVLIINPVNENHESIYKSMKSILNDYRVDASVEVIDNQFKGLSENDIISSFSGMTDLVILGIPDHKFRQIDQHFQQITDLIEMLGSVLVINASENFEDQDVMKFIPQQDYLDRVSRINRVRLPSLTLSDHAEVAGTVKDNDAKIRTHIEKFYAKAFRTLYVDRLQFIDNLIETTQFLHQEIQDTREIKESVRKYKAFEKIKNDTIFRINRDVSEKIKKEKLPQHIDQIREGIAWYIDSLESDYRTSPKRIEISYSKDEFVLLPKDPFRILWYKRFKRIKHKIIGFPIKRRINFRKIARYFILDKQLILLSDFLARFKEDEEEFFNSLRNILKKMNGYLDEIERVLLEKKKHSGRISLIGELEKEFQIIRKTQENKMKSHLDNLKIECRKDLQQMNDFMERWDINSILNRRKIGQKKYKQYKKTILEFDESYRVLIENRFSKIQMELALNTIENRLEILHRDFNSIMVNTFNQKYLRVLDKYQQRLQSQPDKDTFKSDFDLHPVFEADLKDSFDHTLSRMRELVAQLSDNYEIYSGKNDGAKTESEVISVPLERMTEHYLETRYIASLENQFEDLTGTLKESALSVQDAINLTKFNLENLNSGSQEDLSEILKIGRNKLEQEKISVTQKLDKYIQISETSIENVFEPLSPAKIEESSVHFTTALRSYQGKRVISGVSSVTGLIRNYFQILITKLLYIQSEGILLSKKYAEDKGLRSTLSSLLDLKEKVNPDAEVLHALPQYYVNLFNGKSSINENFWVTRQNEERNFKKALERYYEGHRGGIMLLGDKNMGKTALCKDLIGKFLKNNPVYSIFPSLSGSIEENEFSEIFGKVTQIHGNVLQIANKLEKGSVIIVNDLELLWEKSPGGLKNIQLINRLIDDYSNKLLLIVNLNPFAYRVINQITDLGNHFIEIINIQPFDAEDIKGLIMRRHRSSGLSFGYTKQKNELNEIRMAQLFNAYFNYSAGNPGTALNAWLANIQDVNNENLLITKPEIPSTSVIKTLHEDWILLLNLFILHKRMDFYKIRRITAWDDKKIQEIILAMLRSGIIVEKVSGIFIIDPYMQPFLTGVLVDMGVL